MRTLNENLGFRVVATPGTYAAEAKKGNYISIIGFRRILFVPSVTALDADLDVTVYQATDSSGTSAKVLDTTLTEDFANGTDENRLGLIEVRAEDLDDGFDHVTLEVTPGASQAYSCIAVLGEPYDAPVSNGTADSVAFNIGE